MSIAGSRVESIAVVASVVRMANQICVNRRLLRSRMEPKSSLPKGRNRGRQGLQALKHRVLLG
jgi:hypothetical protein